jgi:hypothetical protein
MRNSRILVVLALMVGAIFIIAPGIASANNSGQCSGPNHRVVTKPVQLEGNLKAEGPKALKTMKTLARELGWSPQDGPFHNWLKNRTIIVRTKKPLRIRDYFCRGGTMKFWKFKTVPAGTPMVVVLPDKLQSSDVSTKKRKGFDSMPARFKSLAQALCSNASLAEFLQSLFVMHEKVPQKPAKEKKPTPPQTPQGKCNGDNTSTSGNGNITGNCNTQGDCNGENNCNTTTSPCNCSPQPKPKPSPPSAAVDFVQEIDASDYSVNPPLTYTAPIRVHVSAPSGDSLTVTFTSRYGSWPQQDSVQHVTSTGANLVTATYQSPTEQVKEQITVVVFDNTTSQSATAHSNEFDVVKPPANPA